MKSKVPSAWKLLEDNPPILIRLLARRKIGPTQVTAMTLQEIAITSGIPFSRVSVISQQLTWDGIDIPEAERFCAGCHYDPTSVKDRNRHFSYLRCCRRWTKFAYLKKHPLWASEFAPLINRLKSRKAS